MAGSKRPLDTVERSSTATSLSPDDVRAACIYRQLLCEACGLPSFSKFVRFGLVRVTVNPKEGPVLLPIVGLGRPLMKPYALPGLRASTRNTIRVALGRASKQPHVDIKVAQASNSLPTSHELQAAAQSSVLADLRWEKDAVRRSAIERERIVRDARSGRSSEVDGAVWGSSTLHKSAVLFRSWVAEPGLVKGSAKRWQAQLDGGDAAGPAKESSAEADYFKVCLAEMAPPGFNFGTGPSRWREKWRGEFSFLLYYRAQMPGDGGGARAVLEPPCLPAHKVYDEAQPEITAWRVVRKVVGDHVSLAAFRNSIVCHYDCQLGSTPGTAVDGSAAAASSSSAAGATRPGYSVHEPPSTKTGSMRSFRGSYYLFVVDADTMARQTQAAPSLAPGSATTESRTAHQQALDRLCPNSSSPGVLGLGSLQSMATGEGAGPRSGSPSQAGPAAKHRRVEASSAVLEWVSESDLRRLVPSDTLDILSSRGKILAAYGTDPTGSKSSSSASAGQSAETSDAKGTGSASGSAASGAPSRIGGAFARALQLLRGDHADSVGKFLPCRRGCVVRLYHGTKLSLARQLHREGFRRPMCRNLPACRGDIPPRDAGGPCRCQMEGFGVYFGRKDKAMKFATRRAEFDKERGCNVGAVIVADVDLGYCKPALPEPCPCGCGLKYVDHLGSWYSRDGYDALYVSDDSMPASATAEWCVADPARISIVRVEEVVTAVAASGENGSIAKKATSAAGTSGADGGSSSSPPQDYDAVMRGGKVGSGS